MFAKVVKKTEIRHSFCKKSVILHYFQTHFLNKMIYNKKKIVVFDFDGTLTTHDTLLMFLQFVFGTWRFAMGILLFAPLIILMKLKLYDNSKCKEHLFSWFFKGMKYTTFAEYGKRFAKKVKTVARQDTTKSLAQHRANGDTLYIISASIKEWVEPYCQSLGVTAVLATEAEVDAYGRLTGRFSTPNCYGAEKVRRLLAVEPDRETYHLTAYGDSSGDTEMFALADVHCKV